MGGIRVVSPSREGPRSAFLVELKRHKPALQCDPSCDRNRIDFVIEGWENSGLFVGGVDYKARVLFRIFEGHPVRLNTL